MACFTCGLTPDELTTINRFKEEFRQNGTIRYVYRLGHGKELKTVNKKQFDHVYKTQIKPNLKKGAEFFHIQEFVKQ